MWLPYVSLIYPDLATTLIPGSFHSDSLSLQLPPPPAACRRWSARSLPPPLSSRRLSATQTSSSRSSERVRGGLSDQIGALSLIWAPYVVKRANLWEATLFFLLTNSWTHFVITCIVSMLKLELLLRHRFQFGGCNLSLSVPFACQLLAEIDPWAKQTGQKYELVSFLKKYKCISCDCQPPDWLLTGAIAQKDSNVTYTIYFFDVTCLST